MFQIFKAQVHGKKIQDEKLIMERIPHQENTSASLFWFFLIRTQLLNSSMELTALRALTSVPRVSGTPLRQRVIILLPSYIAWPPDITTYNL